MESVESNDVVIINLNLGSSRVTPTHLYVDVSDITLHRMFDF